MPTKKTDTKKVAKKILTKEEIDRKDLAKKILNLDSDWMKKVREKVENKLKEEILEEEKKREIDTSRFHELENVIRDFLKLQNSEKAINMIFSGALKLWSSDVHFDNYEKYVVLRFRMDWVLVDIFKLTKKEYKLSLEKIKYSSHLKLNINNIPQDWKFNVMVWNNKIDIRVSTLPTKFWENVVCRLLDSSNSVIDFESLGFFWVSKKIINEVIRKKTGLILVTGPTGSGKTTTLYTMLSKINSRDKKIITLEDPVEYQLDWVIQSEIDEKAGYTFAIWLRALLRQDPDIIMVWEIRDSDTLEIATTASLTGHLVLSTLHTKSAADTLDRLINMWVEPYILASALDTIIAQRLVRRICPDCKKEVEKSKAETVIIENIFRDIWMKWLEAKNIKLYEWKWCLQCNWTGYKWRVWIYEIINLNDNLRNIIREGSNVETIMREAKKWDMITMKEDWILKAMKGFTTIEEILRVL